MASAPTLRLSATELKSYDGQPIEMHYFALFEEGLHRIAQQEEFISTFLTLFNTINLDSINERVTPQQFPFELEVVARILGYRSARDNLLKLLYKLNSSPADVIPSEILSMVPGLGNYILSYHLHLIHPFLSTHLEAGMPGRQSGLQYNYDFIVQLPSMQNSVTRTITRTNHKHFCVYLSVEGIYRMAMQGETENCGIIRQAFLNLKQNYENIMISNYRAMEAKVADMHTRHINTT